MALAADPILLLAARWLGIASGLLAVLMVVGFWARWGVRFRLVGITSFTTLLALSCAAFAISYTPRVEIPGAVTVPVVFDNGTDLVVAVAPPDLAAASIPATVEQVARNLRGNGRNTGSGQVTVRLRRIENLEPGLSRPVVLAEAIRNLKDGTVELRP
jgi:hypothetical protein